MACTPGPLTLQPPNLLPPTACTSAPSPDPYSLRPHPLSAHSSPHLTTLRTHSCVQVVGALLDAEAEESFVNNLILSVRSLVPVEALVEEVEKRNKLKLLNPFLEQLVSEGSKVRAGGGKTGRGGQRAGDGREAQGTEEGQGGGLCRHGGATEAERGGGWGRCSVL